MPGTHSDEAYVEQKLQRRPTLEELWVACDVSREQPKVPNTKNEIEVAKWTGTSKRTSTSAGQQLTRSTEEESKDKEREAPPPAKANERLVQSERLGERKPDKGRTGDRRFSAPTDHNRSTRPRSLTRTPSSRGQLRLPTSRRPSDFPMPRPPLRRPHSSHQIPPERRRFSSVTFPPRSRSTSGAWQPRRLSQTSGPASRRTSFTQQSYQELTQRRRSRQSSVMQQYVAEVTGDPTGVSNGVYFCTLKENKPPYFRRFDPNKATLVSRPSHGMWFLMAWGKTSEGKDTWTDYCSPSTSDLPPRSGWRKCWRNKAAEKQTSEKADGWVFGDEVPIVVSILKKSDYPEYKHKVPDTLESLTPATTSG